MKICVLKYDYCLEKWYVLKAFDIWSDAEEFAKKHPESIIQVLDLNKRK